MSTEVNKDILYLVTGAAGFLGGTVCRQLIDNGCRKRRRSLKAILQVLRA